MKKLTPIVLAILSLPAGAQVIWEKAATEDQAFQLAEDGLVRYGTGNFWREKSFPQGPVLCANSVFGDPKVGIVKECQIQKAPPPVLPHDPNHGNTGPVIDMSSVPVPQVGRFVGLRVGVNNKLLPVKGEGGEFRVGCDTTHYLKDDPLLYPGQPGRAHLHAFFGNSSTSAYSTQESLLGVERTGCVGGTANRSSYWVPTIIDILTGKVIPFDGGNIYYKKAIQKTSTDYVAFPQGMAAIAGDAKNEDDKKTTGRFICYGPQGQNPGWAGNITDAVAKGTCVAGGKMVMEVNFPQCWDGKNLRSANHTSHLARPVKGACPTTHPKKLPHYTMNMAVPIKVGMNPANWALSSDSYVLSKPKLKRGLSAHADAIWNWDPVIQGRWLAGCVNGKRDCHNHFLGDGGILQ